MRKKLKKHIGKKQNYTGVAGIIRTEEGSGKQKMCIEDVKLDGKLLTDHIWISYNDDLRSISKGDTVLFTATAYTYTDSNQNRKNGLKHFSFKSIQNSDYEEMVQREQGNFKKRHYK